jgi:hypothetical protein
MWPEWRVDVIQAAAPGEANARATLGVHSMNGLALTYVI